MGIVKFILLLSSFDENLEEVRSMVEEEDWDEEEEEEEEEDEEW